MFFAAAVLLSQPKVSLTLLLLVRGREPGRPKEPAPSTEEKAQRHPGPSQLLWGWEAVGASPSSPGARH